jgi:hypothetical protein
LIFPSLRAAAALAAAILLAACGTPSGPPARDAAPGLPGAAVLPPEAAPARGQALVPPPPLPPKRLAAADLAGWSSAEVTRRFGQPRLLRREPPAEIWQFPGTACTMLVFLFPAGPGLAVEHVDIVARRAGQSVSGEDCIEGLLGGPPPLS